MTQVLTIVGASARAAADSAVRGGFSVRAADLFCDLDLQAASHATRVNNYPAGLAAIVGGPQPGGWMYTGALENHPALVQRMARLRSLWGNSAEVLRRVRRPELVADALRAAGLAYPEIARPGASLNDRRTWLCKPLLSGGGTGITFYEPQAGHKMANWRDHYLQAYVDGLACSAVYVAARRTAVLLGATRQLVGASWTGAPRFCYCGSVGPLEMSAEVAATFTRLGEVLARHFDLVGLFGVDAIVNQRGVWPMEVNPRYTASAELLDWACDIAAVDLHVAACREGTLPASLPATAPGRVFGKAIIFAESAGVIATNWNHRVSAGARPLPELADIPAVGTRVESGWPIVTVVAAGQNEQQVLDELRQRAPALRASVVP